MTLAFTPQAEAFRLELRGWLERNLDDELRALGHRIRTDEGDTELLRRWQGRLAEAGYAAISWPVEYGGRGAGPLEQVAYVEELDRAGAPGELNPIGMNNIAPAIMAFGSEAQKSELLPRMRRGDDIWCQGFSEPAAGSDLASLRTRAVRAGDGYRVTGQKVWTTLANVADWCELLVRTDVEAPKHKGITCLLVDMRSPGVGVRPLRTMTGEYEFNEIFFDDVAVPAEHRLGPENGGWMVAMTTLDNERAGVLKLYLWSRRKVRALVDAARERGLAGDPQVRRTLGRLWLEAEQLRALSDASVRGALGGQGAGPEASLGKLVWSELDAHIADAAAEILGPDANTGDWAYWRLATRGLSIAGGTTQVNKNVLAQRVLGLPR